MFGSDWSAHWAALRAMEYLQRDSRITGRQFVAAATAVGASPAVASETEAAVVA